MIVPISHDTLVDMVVNRGIPNRAAAEAAVRVTVAALGQRLTDDEAARLGRYLAPDLLRIFDQNEIDLDLDAVEIYERVHRTQRGMTAGGARERTQIVLRALGEGLDDEMRRRLVRALPLELGRHFEPRHYGTPTPYPPPPPPAGHTLPDGRPGALHPLSEARQRRS